MITIEYLCPDGTPFPVEFEDEDAAAKTWRFDRSHVTDPQTPLGAALNRLGHPGVQRAFEECGLPGPPGWRPGPMAFGFAYGSQDPPGEAERERFVEGCRVLIDSYGGAGGIWSDLNLPIVRRECEWLAGAGPEASLQELGERQQYAWAHTMISILVSGNDITLLASAIKDLYGDEAEVIAYELTQGYPNETVRADAQLWRLGRMVRTSNRLKDALDAPVPRAAMDQLRAAGREPEFFTALDSFLALYGRRAEEWDIAAPTWQEQGDGLWAQIRHMARDDVTAPDEVLAKGAQRRKHLIAEIDGRLTDEEARARFHRRVGRLASYVSVREERALWQLISTGELRRAVLRRGAELVRRGVLAAADDILYLTPGEIEAAESDGGSFGGGSDGSEARIAAERREERERWKKIEPPPVIGGEIPSSDEAEREIPADGLLRGGAAARGVATGRARVVTHLDASGRIEAGDVLVCHMTSPPWTPLFGIVAGVVCEHGFAGSHAAIASREYGIPCVALSQATVLIPDGATVTVDGLAGTVQIEPEP